MANSINWITRSQHYNQPKWTKFIQSTAMQSPTSARGVSPQHPPTSSIARGVPPQQQQASSSNLNPVFTIADFNTSNNDSTQSGSVWRQAGSWSNEQSWMTQAWQQWQSQPRRSTDDDSNWPSRQQQGWQPHPGRKGYGKPRDDSWQSNRESGTVLDGSRHFSPAPRNSYHDRYEAWTRAAQQDAIKRKEEEESRYKNAR